MGSNTNLNFRDSGFRGVNNVRFDKTHAISSPYIQNTAANIGCEMADYQLMLVLNIFGKIKTWMNVHRHDVWLIVAVVKERH